MAHISFSNFSNTRFQPISQVFWTQLIIQDRHWKLALKIIFNNSHDEYFLFIHLSNGCGNHQTRISQDNTMNFKTYQMDIRYRSPQWVHHKGQGKYCEYWNFPQRAVHNLNLAFTFLVICIIVFGLCWILWGIFYHIRIIW